MRAHGQEIDPFAARDQRSTAWWRSDPPPELSSTTWLRVALGLLLFAALGVTLWSRVDTATFAVTDAPWIVGLHFAAAVALIGWSYVSMRHADALVPATPHRSRSRGWIASSLWLAACAAPIFGVTAMDAVRELVDDAGGVAVVDRDIMVAVMVMMVVTVVMVVTWLPFRYLAVHATRIGVSRHVVTQWFWLTALAFGGGCSMMALGLGDDLHADGVTATERLIEAAVIYGLPMLMFTLTAWRATSAFDVMIETRRRRWKTDWDRSVVAFGVTDERDR